PVMSHAWASVSGSAAAATTRTIGSCCPTSSSHTVTAPRYPSPPTLRSAGGGASSRFARSATAEGGGSGTNALGELRDRQRRVEDEEASGLRSGELEVGGAHARR